PKYDAPFEIYKSSLDGSSISRVTSSQGYDGEGSLHPFQESLAFASARRSPLGVYIVNLASQRAHLVSGPNRAAAEPSFSPDGKRLVWVSYSKDWKISQLIVADATGK